MGGLQKTLLPITTKKVGCGKAALTFVKLALRDNMLLNAVGRPNTPYTDLSRTSLLKSLHEIVEGVCNGDTNINYHANDVEDEDDEVDPMDEIEAPKDDKESPPRVRGNGHTRARYYKNMKKNCVVKVDMPMHCLEIVEADSTNREMKEITLYI